MYSTANLIQAAQKIQRMWRSFIDMQVFKYYKELINFKNRGDPALMLRCINPKEAGLIDTASGTKVRFRLGGENFPPCIYYKIYTERNIVDLCANSPKNYCHSSNRLPDALHCNNKLDNKTETEDNDIRSWYHRIENNGWRLVSDQLLHTYNIDQLTWESSQKTYIFHHNKLQRKQDGERRKKLHKIEWMKKMYKIGILQSLSKEEANQELIVADIIGMPGQATPKIQETWEVDKLLDWTVGLDFDDYLKEWKHIGTTKTSQSAVDKLKLSQGSSDPSELTLSLLSEDNSDSLKNL